LACKLSSHHCPAEPRAEAVGSSAPHLTPRRPCPHLVEGDIGVLTRGAGFDVVDGCAGRPAKGRRWKSVTVKE
jgi:hypothetical protein